MTRLAITETDGTRADRLLEAVKRKSRTDVAQVLAEIREEALACAMVRVERLMEVRYRRQPGLPFDEATTLCRKGTTRE